MTGREIGFGLLSVAIIGGIVYGKYKLATLPPVWWVLILGGIVFVASSPAQAE